MARILIVDDEAGIRELLAQFLPQDGHSVQTAGSGFEAMWTCAAQPFDLVISDVVMPGMDGHHLARWLALNHPATQMALMTGYDVGCQEEGCPYSPRCEFLAKPFSPGEAVEFVRKILVGSEPDGE
jgi:DNA-binding NtrC family response regulator